MYLISLVFDDIFKPIYKVKVAIFIKVANISRQKPTIRIESTSIGFWVVDVAFGNRAAFNTNLSHRIRSQNLSALQVYNLKQIKY